MLQSYPVLNDTTSLLENALAPWQTAITKGNHAFESQSFYLARDQYHSALYLVSNLIEYFTHQYDSQLQEEALAHCCPAFVVAAHNLADCYLALSEPHKACEQLINVHLCLTQLCDHANPQIAMTAMRHSLRTREELIRFINSHEANTTLVSWATQVLDAPHSTTHFH
ncbi:hypothetical protein [Pseudoalteromonas sp. R3]|uniref:hypothetical protein n=1 Tax=Pseudoalteromonas sp. R3 TaxID=1709477 RepID=UPI0006B4CBAC|nr:hypothetical protein [Pseudoalteromonas sp. R3]AZZ97687.1 hypothetical protein ELR70_11475 [Pseudoalteromonas sp. R3]